MQATPTTGLRRFELCNDSSNKFWQITVTDTEVLIEFGRIGTQGQRITKSFANLTAAIKYAEKLIREKLGKGYQEVAT